VRLLVAAVTLAVACGSHAESPGVAPSATSSPAPSAAAASPTLRPNPTAGPGTYTSLALAYRVDIPAGWRRSACGSSPEPEHLPAVEAFTSASVDEEIHSDIGANNPGIDMRVEENPTKQTALQWLESGKLGSSVYTTYEKTFFDGRSDAARVVHSEGGLTLVTAIVVSARAQIFAIVRSAPTTSALPSQTSVMNSVHILSDAELADARATFATPAPAPARTAEDVADQIAKGFAQKDTAVLAAVADPCLQQGGENAGAEARPAAKFLSNLQYAFASGLAVTVQARPVIDQNPTFAAVRGTWKDAGQAQRNVKFMMSKLRGTWYWFGLLYLAP